MADLFKFADNYKLPQLGSTQLLNQQSSLSDGSLFKVPALDTTEKAQVVNASPDALAEARTTVLTEGYAQHPVVQQASDTPADFYRRGKISNPVTATQSQDVQNSNVFSVSNTGVAYDLLPRMLDDAKEEAPASIRMLGKPTQNSTGQDIDLIPPYTKFLLESVQEGHTERSQIVETFGDFYVFFFGERPPIYTFTGTLINAKSINWAEDWMFFYDQFLRGTKCVDLNARLVLTYSFRQIEGFILNTSTTTIAANEKGVQVSFQVLVLDRKILNLSIDFGLIEANGKFNTNQSFLDLLTKGLSNSDVSSALNQVKVVTNGTAAASNSGIISSLQTDSISTKYNLKAIPDGNGGLQIG